jgi:predicted acylesterase/phospholipase RssA
MTLAANDYASAVGACPDDLPAPLDVQIALQGGGAKLYSLLEAMKVVERLEGRPDGRPDWRSSPPRIRVTHIAGTSAGAIVAALYAARVPMQKVISRLETLSLRDVLPPYQPYQPESGGFKRRGRFKRLSAVLLDYLIKALLGLSAEKREFLEQQGISLGMMLLGYPAFETKKLKEQLQDIFNKHTAIRSDAGERLWGDFKDVTIGRFGHDDSIKLTIVRTELRESKPVTAGDNANLLNFLIDSASIPFLLRSVQDHNWDLLDGGICANLPSQFLDGPSKIAIGFQNTFDDQAPPGRSKWTKVTWLLDTTVEYSVERSVDELGTGNCCKLSSSLSTYDFAKIVGPAGKRARENESKSISAQTEQFFKKLESRLRGPRWAEEDVWKLARGRGSASRALFRVLEGLEALSPFKLEIMRQQDYILHIDPEIRMPTGIWRASECRR